MSKMFKAILCTLFLSIFSYLSLEKVQALTIIPDTTCSGSFTCSIYTEPCNWSDSGNDCDTSLVNQTSIEGTCNCQVTTQSASCVTSGSDCRIEDGPCTAGDGGYAGCTINSGNPGPVCGNGSCESGENYLDCPADCGACAPNFSYCGGCINACRKTSGGNSQSCAGWIDDECGNPSCGGNCWCVGSQGACLSNPGYSWGGPGSGWCSSPDGCCCSPCDSSPWGTEAGSCGGGSCGSCQREMIARQSGPPNYFCGWSVCVPDPTCGGGSCSPACGQSRGCGGSCPNTDRGVPGPTSITPPDGGTVTLDASGEISVSWTAADKASHYYAMQWHGDRDYTSVDCDGIGSDDPDAVCGTTATLGYTWTVDPAQFATYGNEMTVAVFPINDTCSENLVGPGSVSTFTIMAPISGGVYLDTNADAAPAGVSQICNSSTATPQAPGIGSGISVQGDLSNHTGGFTGSDHTTIVPWWPSPANNIVTLDPGTLADGTPYVCTCPTNCEYSGIISPQAGLNFYVIDLDLSNAGWWQLENGSAIAEQDTGLAIYSQVPEDTCSAEPSCTPSLITEDAAGTANSAGIAITGGGGIDTNADQAGNQTGWVTERATQQFATGTTAKVRETYDFFYREYSLGTNPVADLAGTIAKPTNPPANGRAYFASGNVVIEDQWQVTSGESLVIFVNGDLTMRDPGTVEQLIDVETGGFLAFIVSGNIIIEETVGNTDILDTTSNIEGVFIADGQIVTQSIGAASGGDNRFVGEGVFVGWSGIFLNRDFDDGSTRRAENNDKPVELFRYRPDFVRNVPERMNTTRTIWQETN